MYPSLGFLKQKNCVPFSIDVECETIIDDESKNIKVHNLMQMLSYNKNNGTSGFH